MAGTGIRLTREVRMSLAYPDWGDASRARNGWAGWPPATALGTFVAVRITVAGTPNATTGYLCDIKDLDELVRGATRDLTVAAEASGGPARFEYLLGDLWKRLAGRMLRDAALDRLEWLATPYLRYSILREDPSVIRVTEQFEFSASHRLHCPSLSDEENRRVFGKCNNPGGHGHNYILEVTLAGQPDARTGTVTPIGQLEQIVAERVLRRFDHKHLNADTVEFHERNPSVENIARTIWDLLDGAFEPARLVNVRVHETAKTWADYCG